MRPIPIAQYLNQFGRVDPSQADRLPVERPQRESVLLKPRVVAPPVDIQVQIEEAFERGRQEGLAAGRAEATTALAQQRGLSTERENASRVTWQANEYAALAEKIETAMGTLEEKLARSVARILKPFLIEEHVKQVTLALSENLAKILSKDAPPVLKITGPETLLSLLHDKLSSYPVEVEYVQAGGVDVTVEANQTVLKTQLQAWIDHIQAMGE
jgi:hypothetical protein